MVLHGIVLYCVVGFGTRDVSRKTPIYLLHDNDPDDEYLYDENPDYDVTI